MNYTFIRSQLNRVNQDLKRKCAVPLSIQLYEWHLVPEEFLPEDISLFDDESQTFDFVLCLNILQKRRKQCVSSISAKIDVAAGQLEFSSKTNAAHEGKKYNLLLRAILILLCQSIRIPDGSKDAGNNTRIQQIVSKAINPISIYLMVKYFHAQNADLNEYMKQRGITYKTLTVADAETFYDESSGLMDFDGDGDDDDEKMAWRMKNDKNFGNPVVLVLHLYDPTVIRQAKAMYHQTMQNLKCPALAATAKLKPKRITLGSGKTKKHAKKGSCAFGDSLRLTTPCDLQFEQRTQYFFNI